MLKFRHYIPEGDLVSFDLAWKEYSEPNIKEYPKTPRLDYESPDLGEEELEIRKKIIKKIEKLTEFAKFR